jgi:hypothetical protein
MMRLAPVLQQQRGVEIVTYHQTQNYLTDAQSEEYRQQAGRQEDQVLAYFTRNAGLAFSPETIQAALMPATPITSVRRAITNLTNDGKLERIGQEVGQYGRPVGTWKLKAVVPEGHLF